MTTTQELNVVVVGPTGAGKSTLVSLLGNAAIYADLGTAEKCSVQTPIFVNFKIHGVKVEAGENDCNERHEAASSRTLNPKIYTWTKGSTVIRLIDCPGIGDTQGSTMDDVHVANILACISRFKTIHGILLVLKSPENRLTPSIKYQLDQILSCFGKTAGQCIRFVLTHAGRFHQAVQADEVLECFLQSVDTPMQLGSENTFCFENNSFRYLVARLNNDVHFSEEERCLYAETYEESAKEYIRLLRLLLATESHYAVDKALILHIARQLNPCFTEVCKTLNDQLRSLYQEVARTDGRVQSLSKEIDCNLTSLEEDQIVTEYVEVPKERVVNVVEEYEEEQIVLEQVQEERRRVRVEDQVEHYDDEVPRRVSVPRTVSVQKQRVVTEKVWVDVEKLVDEYYDVEEDDPGAAIGGAMAGAGVGALLGPIGMLFGAIAGASGGNAAGRRTVRKSRKVPRTVREQQDRDKVEYYTDYETRYESEIRYDTVQRTRTVRREVPYYDTVTREVPKTIIVKKTREVPTIEKYTEKEARDKVVKVVNAEVQEKINRLQELKSNEEMILGNLRQKYEVLKSEVEQVVKVKELLSDHLRQHALVHLEDDAIEKSMDDLLHLEEAHDRTTTIDQLEAKLEELCHLPSVGDKVSEVIVKLNEYKSATFHTVEMKWGYLLDNVIQ